MKKLIFFFLIAAIYYFGCTLPDDSSVLEIRNNSSEDLTVRLFLNGEQLRPQTFVESRKKVPVLFISHFAQTLTSSSPCAETAIDSFAVFVSNDKRLTINLLDENNWTSNFESHRNHNTQNCTLVVTDEDLE